ncbi:MAG: arylesterase [Rhodospirillaceae bacterium]|jgi:acyl-CoA thioesterase I|nr:arylesterase [Rhodospirillaceae bacterium]MBT6402879.1 arylesterase [Rhodospirillaceae bacterium]MBT6535771.1 arylesterase [Rhodospirillaceae bacterium]MBT7360411.1 arylesterase [Rhodospirillaceae bacterium]
MCLFLILSALPVAADDKPVIVAFGDSLSAGYGLDEADSFPVRLQAALLAGGIDAEVVNSGVSGDTTAGGLARLEWSLPDHVDLVILELGANDGLRGIDPTETEANLDAILKTLGSRDIPVLFTGMLAPPNLGREYAAAFDALFPRLAVRHGVVFYPFFLEGVAADRSLNQPDGIHPNAAGVDRIVARLLPFVRDALPREASETDAK